MHRKSRGSGQDRLTVAKHCRCQVSFDTVGLGILDHLRSTRDVSCNIQSLRPRHLLQGIICRASGKPCDAVLERDVCMKARVTGTVL